MVSVEEDDLAGLEDVSSDGEDNKYEADLTDGDIAPTGGPAARKPYRKRACVDTSKPLPLMEGVKGDHLECSGSIKVKGLYSCKS